VGPTIYCGAANDDDGSIVYNPLCGWVGQKNREGMPLRMGTKVYDSGFKECKVFFADLDNVVDLGSELQGEEAVKEGDEEQVVKGRKRRSQRNVSVKERLEKTDPKSRKRKFTEAEMSEGG